MRLVASGLVKGNKTLAMTCVKISRNPAVCIICILVLWCCRLIFSCFVFVSCCVVLSCLAHFCSHTWHHTPNTLSGDSLMHQMRAGFECEVALLPPCSFRFRSPLYSISLSCTPPIRLQDTQSIVYTRYFMKSQNHPSNFVHALL